MTQDNTPYGPIFKARLITPSEPMPMSKRVSLEKTSPAAFRKRACWYWNQSCWVRGSNRALKIGPGGVFSSFSGYHKKMLYTPCSSPDSGGGPQGSVSLGGFHVPVDGPPEEAAADLPPRQENVAVRGLHAARIRWHRHPHHPRLRPE